MYPPFPNESSYLQVLDGAFYHGQNMTNLRETFHQVTEAYSSAVFTAPTMLWSPPSGVEAPVLAKSQNKVNAQVNVDSGDLTMATAMREPRLFGEAFYIKQVCSGKRIAIRVQLNTGWGSAHVLIDGKWPSQIAGAIHPTDRVTCDSNAWGLYSGTTIQEVVLAEGLPDGPHTVELFALNAINGGAFFVYCGMSGRTFSLRAQTLTPARVVQTTVSNAYQLILKNESQFDVQDVVITAPDSVYQADGRNFVDGEMKFGTIKTGKSAIVSYAVDGRSGDSVIDCSMTLSAKYQDPQGPFGVMSTTTILADSSAITYTGGQASWFKDTETPEKRIRAFNTIDGASMSFQSNAEFITITMQKEYGYGQADLYVDGKLITTLDCNDEVGGGFLSAIEVKTVADNYDRTHYATIELVAKSASAPFAFVQAVWESQVNYSQVTESVPIAARTKLAPPFPITGAEVKDGKITYDAPVRGKSNWVAPLTNLNLSEIRTYGRFPTFCVYYGSGQEDTLSEYDILVVEPSAVSHAQVKRWRDAGIKVYGYVSFGEEDGDRTNMWDLADTNRGPHVDDGKGPGGYASYYNKGGNGFGEASECLHDCQRVQGLKKCQLNNPNYLTSVGRCSPVCSYDTRDGCTIASKGGACPQGYTKSDYYTRGEMAGCQNSACPKYKPLNNKCGEYQIGDVVWGQDLAIADVNYPDQNGIWGSSFINPLQPRWKEKLLTHYLPTTFGAPVFVEETLTMEAHTTNNGDTVYGFQLSQYPIDDTLGFTIATVNGLYTYKPNVDYSYDQTTGVVTFPSQVVSETVLADYQPLNAAGNKVVTGYWRKGLECDGVFMDTVDTVDVYPSETFQQAFADMINDLKSTHYPDKMFCSNRGFSIMPKIIKSCSHVMFESFLVEYNWNTDEYTWISNPDSIKFNDDVKAMLRELRRTHVFDVLALNYCKDGTDGDVLRAKIYQSCYAEGYMCWTATILLNSPEKIRLSMRTNRGGRIQTVGWQPIKREVVS